MKFDCENFFGFLGGNSVRSDFQDFAYIFCQYLPEDSQGINQQTDSNQQQ
jgi:hypothetical protein